MGKVFLGGVLRGVGRWGVGIMKRLPGRGSEGDMMV